MGHISESWKVSAIKTLYKGKEGPEDPNSYRGIALETNVYKLFSTIVNRRLRQKLDTHTHTRGTIWFQGRKRDAASSENIPGHYKTH